MFLVTGGYDDESDELDSTETLDPMLGRWTASGAKLPRPMSTLRAANINDRVLIFGNTIISNPFSKSASKCSNNALKLSQISNLKREIGRRPSQSHSYLI